MGFIHVFFLICLFSVMNNFHVDCTDEPRVKTKYGTFIGKVMKSRDGRDFSAFLGIPYAKPPLGKLRFMEPEPLNESNDVVSANKPASDCVQETMAYDPEKKELVMNETLIGSEDCLYLNIYVPKQKNENTTLPVMIYIHGGGYKMGSASPVSIGPQLFMDRNLIMVVITYRLGILGYLSASDDIPENVGMKDQTQALKWVKENIGDFGGDPNAITLAGLSAGASSVTLHQHSKLSKGLFQRGIANSGTLYCPWALRSRLEARTVASKILNYLSCSNEPNQLLECLQNKSLSELFSAVSSLNKNKFKFTMVLGPVIERESPSAFITKESISESSTTPLLTGITNEEGLIFYSILVQRNPSFKDLSPMKTNAEDFLPILSYYTESPSKQNITSELANFYLDNQYSEDKVDEFVKMLSDTTFNHGLHLLAKKYKGVVYQYLWSYKPHDGILPFQKPPGFENSMTHGDDYLFTICMDILPANFTENDLKYSNYILDLWSNFVINGDPTPEDKSWKESNGGVNYLEFTNDDHSMKTHLFKERMEFLDKIQFNNIL